MTLPATLHCTISQTGAPCGQPSAPVVLTWNGSNYQGSYTWVDSTHTTQTATVTFFPIGGASQCTLSWIISQVPCGDTGITMSGSAVPINLTGSVFNLFSFSCNCANGSSTTTTHFNITA